MGNAEIHRIFLYLQIIANYNNPSNTHRGFLRVEARIRFFTSQILTRVQDVSCVRRYDYNESPKLLMNTTRTAA